MARRPGRASTTLATALTIPVNIGGDQEIIAESGDVEITQARRVVEVFDPRAAKRAWRFAAADQHRRHVSKDPVDQTGLEESGVDLSPSFHQDAQEVAPAELLEKGFEVDAAVGVFRNLDDLCQAHIALFRRGDQCVGADDPGRLPDAQLAVEDDSQGLAAFLAFDPGGELWVVAEHGVDSDQDGVVLMAEAVRMRPRLLPRDPARLTRRGRDLAVQARRKLGADEWSARAAVLDVELV